MIEPIEPAHIAQDGLCNLRFLAWESAPQEVLGKGVTFKLFEGRRIVADGEIVDDGVE